MLSTKDVPAGGSGIKKTLGPGNYNVTIYDVELVPGYNPGSYQILLRVEGPNLGPEFDGFLKDKNNPGGPKFSGQVGRIRISQYAFEDKTFADGTKVSRDITMLRVIDRLAISCGVQDEVKNIVANDWSEMINQVKRLFIGKKISVCLAAREYTNKSGYKEFDLFLPKPKDSKYSHTAVGDPSLIIFNEADHIVKEKVAAPVEAFEPTRTDQDFDLF
jgi:hypothetical protein